MGSEGSGLSSVERDTDLLMAGSLFELSIAMIGITTSFDSDSLRSRSLVIDRRKLPKGLREELGLGETETETGVAFLWGPKGKRERSDRKEGIPELAGVEVGVDGE